MPFIIAYYRAARTRPAAFNCFQPLLVLFGWHESRVGYGRGGTAYLQKEKQLAKEFAKPFYNSKEWQKCRTAYISHRRSIDGGMCESCHRVPGYIVHHKIELTPENINDPDITLNFSNLKYDCHECHNIEHMKSENEQENLTKYFFDETGEMRVLPP